MTTHEAGAPPATHELTAPDGRVLRYCLYGPPDGTPLLWQDGTPGTRWQRPQVIEAFERAGLRVLVHDRPGYGGSTRQQGRGVADVAGDARLLADAVGWERFAVTGLSGGGPHALACAALLADRVTRCAAVVSPAPADADGLDFFEGMSAGNIEEFSLAAKGEQGLRPVVEQAGKEAFERVQRGEPMIDPAELCESDAAEMLRQLAAPDPGLIERMRAMWLGSWDGWIDDDIAFTRPWGFDVRNIQVPVSIWYGRQDVLVPPGHPAWLLAQVPGTEGFEFATGHMTSDDDLRRVLDWLRARSG
jgi:pimeloyl-ACP methyl ester carboxylesterase